MTPRIELRARVRAEPLPVRAVFARGAAAHALARRLTARGEAGASGDAELEGVSIVRADPDGVPVLVALGPAERLPWVDGVVWLGRAPEAPSIWLPTLCVLDPHAALVASAFALDVPAPFALVPDGAGWIALSLARASRFDAELLAPLLAPPSATPAEAHS